MRLPHLTLFKSLVMTVAVSIRGPGLALAEPLELNFNGLDDLGAGWAYEGWLIVDGGPVSTGTFTVNAAGKPSATRCEVGNALGSASTFVLTIEPDPDPDPGPSNTHLMGGDLAGGAGRLSVGHTAALGDDFLGASGSYILAVPSDDTGSAAHSQGIWWLDPGAGLGLRKVGGRTVRTGLHRCLYRAGRRRQ